MQPLLLMRKSVIFVAERRQETPLSAAVLRLSTGGKGSIGEVKLI